MIVEFENVESGGSCRQLIFIHVGVFDESRTFVGGK